MTKILLNKDTPIDLDKLISGRLLIQANSGGGKSWAIRRLVEQCYGQVQIIILDPEGEFGTLREKFDFVLAGKGGETPAEPKSAALLAKRLLELKVSTIIDLYELHPQERKRFVRLFLESMVNVPKELYHPTLIILDEAHIFAPEKGQSEALNAVVGMMTLGRKREFALTLATQRISKLNKDAVAECNNKLIGRASLDIDRKRASEELGITNKEDILALRSLKPGEFFAFGSAISDEVIKIKIGSVETSIPKGGKQYKVVPPTEGIKKILAKLADLPEEAQKEASTVKEMKAEITQLKRHRCPKVTSQEDIDKAVKTAELNKERSFDAERSEMIKQTGNFLKIIHEIGKVVQPFLGQEIPKAEKTFRGFPVKVDKTMPPNKVVLRSREQEVEITGEEITYGLCERKIYSFLYQNPDRTFSKIQIAVITGYSQKSGGFNNAISRLASTDLISRFNGKIRVNRLEQSVATEDIGEFSIDLWTSKLPRCEREIFIFLLNNGDNEFSKEEVAEQTGYSSSSGGFNNAISRLNSLGLITRENGTLKINEEILNL